MNPQDQANALAAEIIRLQSPPVELAQFLNKFPNKELLKNWLNLNDDLSPNFDRVNDILKAPAADGGRVFQ
jgi:hypothetical protein|tara:strand:+ start:335 stop:547 length:213 start_codon:yes stop_codon:yes gene_type:complete